MMLCPESFAGRIAFCSGRHIFALRNPASGCLGPFHIADASLPVPQNPEGFPMSSSQWRWKQCEVTRAAKAVQATGLPVRNVEIGRDGTIRVNVGEPDKSGDPLTTADTANEWDDVK